MPSYGFILDSLHMRNLPTIKLLNLYRDVSDELLRRGVVRTRNAPISDYAEWLVAKGLGLKLENSSKSGHDAISKSGARYQVKCRRITGKNGSRQLGVIRNIDKKPFDELVAVFFNEDFTVDTAYMLPLSVVKKYAKHSDHQNGHILIMKGPIFEDKKVRNITNRIKRLKVQ